jgi:hypothetical protein
MYPLLELSVLVAIVTVVPSASAQIGEQDAAPSAPVEMPPEQVFPCNPGDYVPSPEIGAPDVPPAIDCGEVIVPPPGLDPEINEPLPEGGTGSIRVIPPSAIDPQS